MMEAIKQRATYVADGGNYSAYDYLVLRLSGVIATFADVEITVVGKTYVKRFWDYNTNIDIYLEDVLSAIKTNPNQFYLSSQTGNVSSVPVTINAVYGGDTLEITINVWNCKVRPDAFMQAGAPLCTQTLLPRAPYFEHGVSFYGVRNLTVTTQAGATSTITSAGQSGKISYLSLSRGSSTGGELQRVEVSSGGGFVQTYQRYTKNIDTMLKFQNRFGVWEYLLLDGEAERSPRVSGDEYAEFDNGYWAFGGDVQDTIRLTLDDFPMKFAPVLQDLSAAPNVWVAQRWQFSPFVGVATNAPVPDGALPSTERLLTYTPTNTIDLAECALKFPVGSRVFFSPTDSPSTQSMWGTVLAYTPSACVVKFTETSENTGVLALDVYVTLTKSLQICAFDAWALAAIENITKFDPSLGSITLEIDLRLNPMPRLAF